MNVHFESVLDKSESVLDYRSRIEELSKSHRIVKKKYPNFELTLKFQKKENSSRLTNYHWKAIKRAKINKNQTLEDIKPDSEIIR